MPTTHPKMGAITLPPIIIRRTKHDIIRRTDVKRHTSKTIELQI